MLKPALQLRLGQQLTMTPQLQQAIKLLQLPVLELQAQVQLALESNVMLEVEDEESQELTPLEQEQAVDQAPRRRRRSARGGSQRRDGRPLGRYVHPRRREENERRR